MTSGRSPFADDSGTPRYGPGATPTYGPGATPPTYGPEATPRTYAPEATQTYGPSTTPTYGTSPPGAFWPSPPASDAGWSPAHPDNPGYGDTAAWPPTAVERAAPGAGSRRHFQRLSWIALVLAVVVPLLLGICIYAGLATLSLSTDNAFSSLASWLTTCGIVAGAAVAVFVLAVCAVLVSRPKFVAVTAAIVAVVLPVVVVHLAVQLGLAEAGHNVAADSTGLVNLLNAAANGLGDADGPAHAVLDRLLGWVGSLA